MTELPRPAKRLPKAERHRQLLDTALRIIRQHGADALTLGVLAEAAGVSKPVTYEHFGTRSGLLIELYRRIDDRQADALRAALARAPSRLSDIAQVMSTAYMDCHTTAGPEWHAVSAALKGDAEMDSVQHELVQRCVLIFRDALRPFSDLDPAELHVRCIGIVGAAEALSQEMTRGTIERIAAIGCLTTMATLTASAPAPGRPEDRNRPPLAVGGRIPR
ncbi:TetR/AcrR family transcriptional regulator [Nocardia sp. NBC_01329]|uniref:TetR/AcrR family transcriptional regulator n=1 Tax=Nocardia sp. NBC_01329 TaxID=2903594 RepID=UPI002E0FE732|nr:TetR/AcrR family transcriptional regulator [Nocardia sp. NBC_01329]